MRDFHEGKLLAPPIPYPDFLYPGGSKVIDKDYEVSKTKQFKSRKLQNLQYHVIIVSGGLND